MKELILILMASIFTSINASSQDFDFFDYPLNSDKITLCQAIEKYGINDNNDFRFVRIGKRLHSLVVKYDHKIFANNSFVLIRDTINSNEFKLNQVALSSKEFQINEKNFKKLLDETNRIINQFEKKYGKPTKSINNKDRYFGQKNEEIVDEIIATTWDSNNIKLKITFYKGGEHGHYHYYLDVSTFEDYFGNMKLPEWWNGY